MPDRTAERRAVDLLRLCRADGVGPVAYRRLLARHGSAAAALDALPRLAEAAGRPPPAIPGEADAEREIAAAAKLGAIHLFLGDPVYPPLLAMLDDAPPCLMVRGDKALLSAPAVALVGGRNASANGLGMAETLASELAGRVVVVSGLARGVDAAAHIGALRAGRTVAVVAGGVDVAYPPENAELQARIAREGAVVSGVPLGTQPLARHFPRRNRIVAGLALGVVVVEAAPRSGSLITARVAQDAGREVFAVPGCPLDPRARGGNDLIRQGAVLVETVDDVLSNLPMPADGPLFRPRAPLRRPPRPAAPEAAAPPGPEDAAPRDRVLALLSPAPTAVDDLVRRCQLSSSAALAALLELELAGGVRSLPGGRIQLVPDAA